VLLLFKLDVNNVPLSSIKDIDSAGDIPGCCARVFFCCSTALDRVLITTNTPDQVKSLDLYFPPGKGNAMAVMLRDAVAEAVNTAN